MTQENSTQEMPTLTHDRDELTAADLTHVVGGGEGPPTTAGDHNGRSER